MTTKIDIWHIIFAVALIIAISLYFGKSYDYSVDTKQLEADIEQGKRTIDSLDMEIMKNQIILDSLKLTFIQDTAKITQIQNYYDTKINGVDSISIDSLRKLLAGHVVHN